MNNNQQNTTSHNQQIKGNASGGEALQKQVSKYTRYEEIRTDALDAQIMHWNNLEERCTHCPESLTPLDFQHLTDYRNLYGEYQYRIAAQIRAEQKEGN